MSLLRALWPVVDESLLAAPDDLLAEAVDLLPLVANRTHVRLTPGPPRVWIAPGRLVPGSGGARWVVVAEAPAVALVRAYHRRTT